MDDIEEVWTVGGAHYARTADGVVIQLPDAVWQAVEATLREGGISLVNVPAPPRRGVLRSGPLSRTEIIVLALLNTGAVIAGYVLLTGDPTALTIVSDILIWTGLSVYLVLRFRSRRTPVPGPDSLRRPGPEDDPRRP